MGFFGLGSVNPHNWRYFVYGRSPYFYVFIAIVLGLVFYAMSRSPGKTTTFSTSPRQSAWAACTMFVEKQLGISASDAEEYNLARVTLLSENSFQVDVYYEKLNVFYQCTLEKAPDGNWQLISLQEE